MFHTLGVSLGSFGCPSPLPPALPIWWAVPSLPLSLDVETRRLWNNTDPMLPGLGGVKPGGFTRGLESDLAPTGISGAAKWWVRTPPPPPPFCSSPGWFARQSFVFLQGSTPANSRIMSAVNPRVGRRRHWRSACDFREVAPPDQVTSVLSRPFQVCSKEAESCPFSQCLGTRPRYLREVVTGHGSSTRLILRHTSCN